MLTKTRANARPIALALTASLLAPTFLAGCGSGTQTASAPPPPREATPGEMQRMNPNPAAVQPARRGMTTKQKVVILAGAALLYYLYKRHQAKNPAPQGVQYYLSKSTGRVYYRDPQTHQAIWMTPPPNEARPMTVPEDVANDYRDYQGYNNQTAGRQLSDEFQLQ